MRSRWYGASSVGSGSRNSSSGSASRSRLTNTNPPKQSTRTERSARSSGRFVNSSRRRPRTSAPSSAYCHPWYGHWMHAVRERTRARGESRAAVQARVVERARSRRPPPARRGPTRRRSRTRRSRRAARAPPRAPRPATRATRGARARGRRTRRTCSAPSARSRRRARATRRDPAIGERFDARDMRESIVVAGVQPRGPVRAAWPTRCPTRRGRRAATTRAPTPSSTSARPGSRTRSDVAAGRARRPVPPQLDRARRADARVLQGARRPGQRQLALHRGRDRSTSPTTPTSSQLLARRRRRARPRSTHASSRPAHRTRDFGGSLGRRPTTCSTPAARPAGPRAWCGGRRTSSSPRSAAGTPAGRRSTDPPSIAALGRRQPGAATARVPPARRSRTVAVRRARARTARARERSVVGARHAARRRQARALHRRARRHGARARPRRTRARRAR